MYVNLNLMSYLVNKLFQDSISEKRFLDYFAVVGLEKHLKLSKGDEEQGINHLILLPS